MCLMSVGASFLLGIAEKDWLDFEGGLQPGVELFVLLHGDLGFGGMFKVGRERIDEFAVAQCGLFMGTTPWNSVCGIAK